MGKELEWGAMEIWRPPQSLSIAISFDQNVHLSTGRQPRWSVRIQSEKEKTFGGGSPQRDAEQDFLQFSGRVRFASICFNFLARFHYRVSFLQLSKGSLSSSLTSSLSRPVGNHVDPFESRETKNTGEDRRNSIRRRGQICFIFWQVCFNFLEGFHYRVSFLQLE